MVIFINKSLKIKHCLCLASQYSNYPNNWDVYKALAERYKDLELWKEAEKHYQIVYDLALERLNGNPKKKLKGIQQEKKEAIEELKRFFKDQLDENVSTKEMAKGQPKYNPIM